LAGSAAVGIGEPDEDASGAPPGIAAGTGPDLERSEIHTPTIASAKTAPKSQSGFLRPGRPWVLPQPPVVELPGTPPASGSMARRTIEALSTTVR
jgi:hypothetical protein